MLRPLQLLALASLVNGTCFSMLLPLLAPLVRQLHLTELQGGSMVTAAAIAMTLASLIKAKTRRSVLPVTLIVHGFWGMTITWAIFAACLYWGLQGVKWPLLLFIVLVLSRAATGWYMAYVQIGMQSAVMQTVQQTSQRSKNMAALGAANSLGMIIGPLLTSALVILGILTPIWFAVVLFATVTFILQQHFNAQHAFVNNTEKSTQNSQVDVQLQHEQPGHSSATRIVWRQHMVWLILGFVLGLAIVTLNMTAGFYIQDQFGLNAVQSAIHFAQCLVIAAVVLLLSQFALARYFKIGLQRLVMLGCISMIIGLMLSVQAINIMQFKLSYVCYGLAVACLTPAFSTGAAQSVKKQLQLKMASYCTAAQSMGFVVGPMLSTALYQISPVMPFYLVFACVLLLLIYFMIYIKFQSPWRVL